MTIKRKNCLTIQTMIYLDHCSFFITPCTLTLQYYSLNLHDFYSNAGQPDILETVLNRDSLSLLYLVFSGIPLPELHLSFRCHGLQLVHKPKFPFFWCDLENSHFKSKRSLLSHIRQLVSPNQDAGGFTHLLKQCPCN